MDKFKIGQKVVLVYREVPGLEWESHERARVGQVSTITSQREKDCFGFLRYGTDRSDFFPVEEVLEPVIENGDYGRFMERVMKPVDLGLTVTA